MGAVMTAAIYPSLKGKTAFATSGGMGIGVAFVVEFAKQGSTVAVVAMPREARDKLKARLTGDVWFGHCDVTDTKALQKAIADAAATLGPITILVNSAAHDERHAWDRITPEYWDQ